jgi:hypothetical protein
VLAERLVYDVNILCTREEEEEGQKESLEEVGRTPTKVEMTGAPPGGVGGSRGEEWRGDGGLERKGARLGQRGVHQW